MVSGQQCIFNELIQIKEEMNSKFFYLILLAGLFFSTCSKDYNEINKEEILVYLDANNLEAEEHESGIYYIIERTGDGNHPPFDAEVTVRYTGTLLDGTFFDGTQDGQTATFPLLNLIPGWQIGIPLLERGGKGKFFIPSALGYGSRGSGSIPANAVLIFDIELVDF